MNSIDWNKAPEGFDFHFQPKRSDDTGGFYKISKMKDRFEAVSGSYISFRDLPSVSDLFVMNSRPSDMPPWVGVGLPPIGTVCEFREFGGAVEWVQAKLVYLSKHTALLQFVGFEDTEGAYSLQDCEFRPIRTAEQLAAEERERDIEEMCNVARLTTHKSDSELREYIEALYHAGYRKVLP